MGHTQPDTIVPEPGNPQALNRYSYVLNNPLRYNDPSGHAFSECGLEGNECVGEELPVTSVFSSYILPTRLHERQQRLRSNRPGYGDRL